jgi:hypothetical protein
MPQNPIRSANRKRAVKVRVRKPLPGVLLQTRTGYSSLTPNEAKTLIEAYKIIRKKINQLKDTTFFYEDKKMGFRIEHARPNWKTSGEHRGHHNRGILKVTYKRKVCFVKLDTKFHAVEIKQGAVFVDKILKEMRHNIEGVKVVVAQNRLLHDFVVREFTPAHANPRVGEIHLKQRLCLQATDFYPEATVMPVDLIKPHSPALGTQLEKIIEQIDARAQTKVPKLMGLEEIRPHNAFYNPKTNTLILFDLHLYRRGTENRENISVKLVRPEKGFGEATYNYL